MLGCLGVRADAITVEVGTQDNSPVEIVLCAGKTDMDLEDFATRLETALVQAGVARERIRVWADEQKSSYSMSDVGAAEIFNSWDSYPHRGGGMFDAQWRCDGTQIYTTANVHWTGYWDNTAQEYENYSFGAKTLTTTHQDPWGYTFRMTQLPVAVAKSKTNNWTTEAYAFYALELDPCDQGRWTLARINFWAPYTGDPMHGGPLYHYTIGGADGSYHQRYKALRFVEGEVLGYIRTRPQFNTWYNVKIEVDDDEIFIYVDDRLELYVKDPNPLLKGAFGLYTASQYNTHYTDFWVEVKSLQDLVDVVRSPKWESATSHRFYVDVCDEPREDFNLEDQMGELAERIGSDGGYYIGWGTNNSKASINSFVNRLAGKGTYISSRAADVYDQTARYIEPIVNRRFNGEGEIVLIKDKEYNFTTKES